MNDGKLPKILTGADLQAILDDEERRMQLPASDPNHPFGFERPEGSDGWAIWWGGYEYFVDDGRLSNPAELLDWVEHLCDKTWRGMTPEKIGAFIRQVKQRWTAND